MQYEFKCVEHGIFEVSQPIQGEHKATCPVCGTEAQRVYHSANHFYDNPKPLFHKDGKYEEF